MFEHRYLAAHRWITPALLAIPLLAAALLLIVGQPVAAAIIGGLFAAVMTWAISQLSRRRIVADAEQIRWLTPNGTIAHRNVDEVAAVRLGRTGRFFGLHVVDVTGRATGIAALPTIGNDRSTLQVGAKLADHLQVPGPDPDTDPADYRNRRLTL